MLENEDAAGGNDAIGSLPTNAPTAPPIPQPVPSGQPPTRPTEAAPQAPPLTPGPAAPSRSFMGALAHALIGSTMAVAAKGIQVAAGPPAPDSYTTDASGKTTPNFSRTDNTRSRLERLAQHALEGLAAGAQIGPQKSKAAAWGAGIGAGAQAEMQRTQGDDLLKRKQAQEEYDTQQKTLTDKAVRAMHNASTYSLWQKAIDEQNDHDPERKKNMDVVNALQEYNDRNPKNGMSVQIVTPEAAMAMHEADNHSVAKHTYLPLGMTGAKDANGNPVFEQDGVTPKQTGQIAVISGDGKLPLPQSFVDDAKEYGKLAGISGSDQLTANMEVPLATFLNIDKRINDVKLKESDGWKNAHDVILADGKTHAQMNPVTSKTRPYPEGVTPLAVKKEEAEIEEKKASAFEKEQLGRKAKKDADTEALFNPAASSGLTGDDYLKSLPPAAQNVLKAIAEGRETRSPRQLQDKNGNPTPLAEALHKGYPDFDDKKAAAYGGLVKDFTTGPTSRSLTAYGTAINHARSMYDNTGPKSYVPGTNEYKRYHQDVTYVATEVARALNPGGVAAEGTIKEQEEALSSTFNRKAAIENAEHILTGKMAEIKQRWLNGQVRPSYQPPMPNLSREAMDNADYIRNHGKVSQPSPQSGQPNPPAGASHIGKDANGNVVGYVLNGQWVSAGGKQ